MNSCEHESNPLLPSADGSQTVIARFGETTAVTHEIKVLKMVQLFRIYSVSCLEKLIDRFE